MTGDTMRNFGEMLYQAKKRGPVTLSVAAAEDDDVLIAVAHAIKSGIAGAILIGDRDKINPLLEQLKFPITPEIMHEPDPVRAAQTAVDVVRAGDAQILMKGLVNSGDFMRAVLHHSRGLRSEYRLSHLAAFEVPRESRIAFMTDAGINIAPDLQGKKEILMNAIMAIRNMGFQVPNVAVISANEKVSDKMQSTVDAQNLVHMNRNGAFPPAIVEGPIAFDVAVSQEAAHHKGIESSISGKTDLFLMPNIETANVAYKMLTYWARAKTACLVLGATHPIVMTSRSDSAEAKLYSIAMAAATFAGADSAAIKEPARIGKAV
jgi:phosphate butyryltransferase